MTHLKCEQHYFMVWGSRPNAKEKRGSCCHSPYSLPLEAAASFFCHHIFHNEPYSPVNPSALELHFSQNGGLNDVFFLVLGICTLGAPVDGAVWEGLRGVALL